MWVLPPPWLFGHFVDSENNFYLFWQATPEVVFHEDDEEAV